MASAQVLTGDDTRHLSVGFVDLGNGRMTRGPSAYAEVMYDAGANPSRITETNPAPQDEPPSILTLLPADGRFSRPEDLDRLKANLAANRASGVLDQDDDDEDDEGYSRFDDEEDEEAKQPAPQQPQQQQQQQQDEYEDEDDEGYLSESDGEEEARFQVPAAAAAAAAALLRQEEEDATAEAAATANAVTPPVARLRREGPGFMPRANVSQGGGSDTAHMLERLAGFGPSAGAPTASDPYASTRGGGAAVSAPAATTVAAAQRSMPRAEDFAPGPEDEEAAALMDAGVEESMMASMTMPPTGDKPARERFMKVSYLRELNRMRRFLEPDEADEIPVMTMRDSLEDIEAVYVLHMSDMNDAERIDLAADVTWGTFGAIAGANQYFKVLNLKGMMGRLDRRLKRKSTQQLLYRISLALGKSGTTPLSWKIMAFVLPLLMGTHMKNTKWKDGYSMVSRMTGFDDDSGAESEYDSAEEDRRKRRSRRSRKGSSSSKSKRRSRKSKKRGGEEEGDGMSMGRWFRVAQRAIGKKNIDEFMGNLSGGKGGKGGAGGGIMNMMMSAMLGGGSSDEEEEEVPVASSSLPTSSSKSKRSSGGGSGGTRLRKAKNRPKDGVSATLDDDDLDP